MAFYLKVSTILENFELPYGCASAFMYGNQVFTTLTLKLMANNGGVVKTWTANNASSVTGTYADWYSTGDTEWIIEVTGTTSTGTTVTWNGAVRVAKS